MNIFMLISGIAEIILALVLGVLFIYTAFRVFSRLTRGLDELEELKRGNTAAGILISSIILSLIYIVKGSLDTALMVITSTLRNPDAVLGLYLQMLGLMLLQIVISGIIGFFGIFFALNFFMWLTKDIDEMGEVSKNNIAIGILMGVVVFCIALLLQPGIKILIDALIPYPSVLSRNL